MDTKHSRASAGGVIIRGEEVLLIRSDIRNSYGFPKGTLDPGETKDVAALREVKEETGYNVEIVEFLDESTFEFDDKGEHFEKTVTYYLMRLTDDEEPRPDLQPGEDFVNLWVSVERAYELLTFDDAKQILRLAVKASAS